MLSAEAPQPALYLSFQPCERLRPVPFHFEVVQFDAALELYQGEDVRCGYLRRVGVPQEKRVYRARIVGEELFEIEDVRIVFGGLHADVVQRWGVAQVILRGVCVGMEDVRGTVYLP